MSTSSPTASARRFVCDCVTLTLFIPLSFLDAEKPKCFHTSHLKLAGELRNIALSHFLHHPRGVDHCRCSIVTLIAQTFYTLVTVIPQNDDSSCQLCYAKFKNANTLSSTPGILQACVWIFVFFHALQPVFIEQERMLIS